ncbi:hypothetical protein CRENBAI_024693 [Crenichthys baileyi]|uniref:Secreted protein n=1 Tax=Crenichthys baileyi TaxID=28760 RepID=A0AAV9RHK5_9TELE
MKTSRLSFCLWFAAQDVALQLCDDELLGAHSLSRSGCRGFSSGANECRGAQYWSIYASTVGSALPEHASSGDISCREAETGAALDAGDNSALHDETKGCRTAGAHLQQSTGKRQCTPWTGRQSTAGEHRDTQDKQPSTPKGS